MHQVLKEVRDLAHAHNGTEHSRQRTTSEKASAGAACSSSQKEEALVTAWSMRERGGGSKRGAQAVMVQISHGND